MAASEAVGVRRPFGYWIAKSLEQRFVLLPGRDRAKRGVVGDLLQRLAFHLEVRPRIDLRRFRIRMAEKVADDIERNATLQKMHSLMVPGGHRGVPAVAQVIEERLHERRVDIGDGQAFQRRSDLLLQSSFSS